MQTVDLCTKKEVITIRVNGDKKREFLLFCDRVGLRVSVAMNLFINATLAKGELPFSISDYVED